MNISRLVIATLLSVGLPLVVRSQDLSSLTKAPGIEVKVVNSPSLPISVEQALVLADSGRNIYGMRIVLRNTGPTSVDRVRIAVMAVGASGELKGGEVVCKLSLPDPGKELRFDFPLASKFGSAGDFAIVSLLQTHDSEGQTQSVRPKDILDKVTWNIEAYGVSGYQPNIADAGCDGTFCQDCRQIAFDVCARQGIHQYSCSLQTCTCSFTCNTP